MTFSFFDLFWVFFIVSSLQPLWQRRRLESQRVQSLKAFEQGRNSRVILLIHRQESISLLGIPLSRYITIEDSEKILRATLPNFQALHRGLLTLIERPI